MSPYGRRDSLNPFKSILYGYSLFKRMVKNGNKSFCPHLHKVVKKDLKTAFTPELSFFTRLMGPYKLILSTFGAERRKCFTSIEHLNILE